ncbi:MAG TPA: class I SAM-dependent methyltransferase, partial [Candidatus Thermoplasmatota archaeon]|nr:class I SAM-dependent methyltransferase [Candidatus Thermoplasmatota archaeon]
IYDSRVDYEGDVKFLLECFKKYGKAAAERGADGRGRASSGKPKRVLDVGAGTGNHALRLAKAGVKVDAVDISQHLLDVLARKAKEMGLQDEVTLHQMDMTRELPKGKFDGAISMFGAWCYARTDEESSRLLSMLQARLPRGGLFVFEFWSPLGWQPRNNWDEADMPDGTRIVRLHRPNKELKDDVYEAEFEHLVLKDGKLVENFSEVHGLRLRTPYQTRALLDRNGFEVLAFTKGARERKSFEEPGPNEFRVMCIAARK